MIALVTGAAGSVGSHLCRFLLDQGDHVRGVDCFTDFYSRQVKERNVLPLLNVPRFDFQELDLNSCDLRALLEEVDVVYHLAAQPGVRPVLGEDLAHYVRHNIEATQRLLENLPDRPIKKLVFASSSSVYGNAESYPTPELIRPVPVSPYGVTKLAAEHLCELYRGNLGVPSISLRLFTVYGPRQRPDMAFLRLVTAALEGGSFELYGDGDQTRDFTFVGDVVQAIRGGPLQLVWRC